MFVSKLIHTTSRQIIKKMTAAPGCWMSRMVAARADPDRGMLETRWEGGSTHHYPYVWLRDNCQCPQCFHPTTRSRLLLMRDLSVDVKPAGVSACADSVCVTWEDGHVSSYESSWLERRGFTQELQTERLEQHKRQVRYWGSEMGDNLQRVDFHKLLTDDRTLLEWLTLLEEYGIVLLTGAPTEEGQLMKIGNRVAYLRKTHYGETFKVKDKANPNNAAYTNGDLDLHVDVPYYTDTPGMQMLHCITAAGHYGGENEFVDSFRAAEQLREEQSHYFKILSTLPVDYHDVGREDVAFHNMNRKRIISLADDDSVACVEYNNQHRDSYLLLPLHQVAPFYAAMKEFDNLLNHPSNKFKRKLNEGEIVCMNNHRVMHSRLRFETTDTERHLEGAYIDWDELRSRRRVLEGHLLKVSQDTRISLQLQT